jgi:eukaryotic-like serine/threonine-protein kinase
VSGALDEQIAIPEGTVVLEKYQVESFIGSGELGRVFKAVHTSVGSHVAIKFLLPHHLVSETTVRRFVRETKAASRIASEHSVRVFDTGSSHPYGPYVVMEYVDGGDIAGRLEQNGPLSVHDAIDVTVQAALALAEAHASGVVHYGIKPNNLMIARAGDNHIIKVVDFGLAKVAEHPSLAAGMYWPPERLRAGPPVDHRADIYSLAVTLYAMLTNQHPFHVETADDLAAVINDGMPTPIRKLRADLPADLALAVEVGYAKKPDDRYQTVGELAASLAPWASPRTVIAIEALARREMRRSIGSLPRNHDPNSPPASLRSLSARPPAMPGPPESVRSVAAPAPDGDTSGGGAVMMIVAVVLVVALAGGVVWALFLT